MIQFDSDYLDNMDILQMESIQVMYEGDEY